MRISTRLIASFVLVAGFTTVLGAFALERLAAVHDAAELVATDIVPSSRAVAAMDVAVDWVRIADLRCRAAARTDPQVACGDALDSSLAALARHEATYRSFADTPEERRLYSRFEAAWQRYLAVRPHALSSSIGTGRESAVALRAEADAFASASASLARLTDLTIRQASDATLRSESRYRVARTAILLCVVGAFIVSLVLAMGLIRGITQPLDALVDAADAVRRGHFDFRAPVRGHHELARVAASFNVMAETVGSAQRLLEQRVAQRTAELTREKEAHREARQLAETANVAKSAFLANMSHELRTPLNSVIGFADILARNSSKSLAPTEIKYLARIQANGRHLLSLINSVLDLSKVEAGRMTLDITSIPLGSLITDILAELEPQATARNVILVPDVTDSPCFVDADRDKLRQIVINLVGNAIKFSEHGEVRVSVSTDEATGRPLSISVTDTGIGIPPERLASVFEAFQQADNTTSRRFGGTGLGLTITRSLAQLMGFGILVESEVGVGSTFTLTLVQSEEARRGAPSVQVMHDATSTVEAASGGRDDGHFLVLVIDDDPDARAILRQSFEELGCATITAASVDEGLGLARMASPNLITIDLMMPHKSGWDALRELQADPGLRGIPVVVVSAVARENRTHLIGALDVLDKPVTLDDVSRVVGRHRGGEGTPPAAGAGASGFTDSGFNA